MSTVLGVNGFPYVGHDAGAALLVEREIVAAVEEERLVRVKRASGRPPVNAIAEVLDLAGISGRDVDCVTYPWLPSAMGVAESDVEEAIRNWLGCAGCPTRKELQIRFVEHHLAHALSGVAFVPDGIAGRRVGMLVLDGSGESTGGACYLYDGELTRRWSLAQEASLGIYYEAVSEYLGFSWGEEGKTMGLASYGRESDLAVPPLADRRSDGEGPTFMEESPHAVHTRLRRSFVEAFARLHGEFLSFNRSADVAYAAQELVAGRILEYVNELVDDVDVVVLSGGVALNCSINAQVAALCRRKDVELVIPPPASDAGVALGATVAGVDDPASVSPLADGYLGRAFAPEEIARELDECGVAVQRTDTAELAAQLLDRSLVCGWFEGRSELGPRALGKRSIVARADSAAVRDRINGLKGREAWRPLAPSLTPREFERSFPEGVPSPYMLIAARVASQAARRLRGVVHVDDTSRPHVVSAPGPYRDLLREIGDATGTEAVICTSFNRAGEPLVYTPRDALSSARAMGLDLLAGDGWTIPLTDAGVARRPRRSEDPQPSRDVRSNGEPVRPLAV
jgi:carbamoyltransferase